ncbi:MAG: hypothetical protein HKN47_04760 [Pirellulaceae bacterium]|nr:hypothetical protein [Pirellulaceae bacterium]
MSMISFTCRAIDLETLRETVENRLCEIGHLVPQQFPMTQREVIRGGKACGLYFCVHGPRSVKLTAICDFVHNTVIYYGSDGIRKESETIRIGHLCAAAA